MKHYHIQWNDSKLDWKAFQTEEEAEKEPNDSSVRAKSTASWYRTVIAHAALK
jgi:hypothetical protein